MKEQSKEINLFIIGDEVSEFKKAISSLDKETETDININIINNIKFSRQDYLSKFYSFIDDAKYFNVIAPTV